MYVVEYFVIYHFMPISKKVNYLLISKFYYNHNIYYKRKISTTFRLSKPISCRRNKAGGLYRAAHSGLCGSNNKRICMEKKGRRKRECKKERERGEKRFKADQYFIFERRCHDGNRYLKIEKHEIPPRTSNSKERIADG